ncbi:MAG: ATPase, T2SS/T4P/T4SS family [Alphaproteobacteria bacterium]|nr:ATPase, T2SS/T4P/T4SS family [Alphaproteobacteria bacterium]
MEDIELNISKETEEMLSETAEKTEIPQVFQKDEVVDFTVEIDGEEELQATGTSNETKPSIFTNGVANSKEEKDVDPVDIPVDVTENSKNEVENVIDDNKQDEFLSGPEKELEQEAQSLDSQEIVNTGKQRIGDQMVSMGLITEDQLNVALQEKKITNKMLGEILVELGFIEEGDLTLFLAESSGYGLFDPKNTIVDSEALALLEKDIAVKHQILPVSIDGNKIFVAMSDPHDVVALDTLRRFISKDMQVKPLVTTAAMLSDAIDASYGYASSIKDILQELEEGKEQKDVTALNEKEAFAHPIVRLVNALVFEAVKIGASDLHFEPEENFVRLRYRLDGVLFTAQILHKQHWNGISQRLKIMSEMNIADKLSPQDGRFNLNIGGREADFRVSSLPTVNGENIVLRVLDKSASIMPLSALGFSDENKEKIERANNRPEGIIIVTGPTGSGKTTTLYSMLNEVNDVQVNIQTLEDPVEYSLPMIRQTHVREGVLEFADGIKALLRQDPDIIFIGEIRDKTTAEMALKAAMTGHQVFTSLHTNDSFGAIPRLLDLGMKPGMLAGAIIAVFAQRLARRLCGSCKVEYTPTDAEVELLNVGRSNLPPIYTHSEKGCDDCMGKGYKGRVAIVEILLFDSELDEIIARNESKAELREAALKKGFKSMKDDGILKILEGLTSFEAISRVVDLTK